MDDSQNQNETVEEKKECTACGYALAAVGLILGGIFLYMSVDILSGGRVTSLLNFGGNGDDE